MISFPSEALILKTPIQNLVKHGLGFDGKRQKFSYGLTQKILKLWRITLIGKD